MSSNRKACARAQAAVGVADLMLVVFDRSRPLDVRRCGARDTAAPRIVVLNKTDLPPSQRSSRSIRSRRVAISATTGDGLDR